MALNRYRLQLILEDFEKCKSRPTLDGVWPWLGVMLAFLFPLISSDFKDFIGVPASTWEGFSLFAVVASFLGATYKAYQAWKHRNDKMTSPQDLINQLVNEMQTKKTTEASDVDKKTN